MPSPRSAREQRLVRPPRRTFHREAGGGCCAAAPGAPSRTAYSARRRRWRSTRSSRCSPSGRRVGQRARAAIPTTGGAVRRHCPRREPVGWWRASVWPSQTSPRRRARRRCDRGSHSGPTRHRDGGVSVGAAGELKQPPMQDEDRIHQRARDRGAGGSARGPPRGAMGVAGAPRDHGRRRHRSPRLGLGRTRRLSHGRGADRAGVTPAEAAAADVAGAPRRAEVRSNAKWGAAASADA
jgi:hypothetical protein